MDILFKCPNCDQELEVDASGAGSKIECPACSQTITVPETGEEVEAAEAGEQAEASASPAPPPAPPKEEKHFVVPVHSAARSEELIGKPLRPLEVAAKDTDRKMRIKTIRHTECVEVGRDRFDEMVSSFIAKVGEDNVLNIHTIIYTVLDSGTRLPMNDFGVVIVYKG
jgi:ribosomal protein S27E